MAVAHLNFPSRYLRGNTNVYLILPDLLEGGDPEAFYRPEQKYPVLWLLHGGMGDSTDWIRRTNIERYAGEHGMITTMFDALNSSYCDWPNFGGGYLAHEYLTRELMPLIYAWFPASPARADNFIAGLSMGGHGAFKMAFNYPERFAACASLSGAIPDFEKRYLKEVEGGRRTHISDLVDLHGGIEGLLASKENTRGVAEKLAREGKLNTLPRLYAGIGTLDPHLLEMRDAVAFLNDLGIPVTYKETKGYAHEWPFWDEAIQDVLSFFTEKNEAVSN